MLTALVLSFFLGTVGAQEGEDALADDHRQWLEEEVSYIISDEERELFLALETPDARDRAIAAFWDHRDPDRLTPENEFRREHYRRLEHASRVFAEGSGDGWRSERGRYYVLLGEPARVERFVGSNEIVDCEVWFYAGEPAKGLPPRFNLLFFKENNVGSYRLYSPIDDGPAALLNAGAFVREEPEATLDVLEAVSVDVARASLTVDLTEAVGGFLSPALPRRAESGAASRIPLHLRPSPSSNGVIATILESATRDVDLDYVDGYRRYGARVASEYSFRYVSNRDYWTVLYEPDGAPFVHFSLELDPGDVSFRRNDDGTRYEARFQVDIDVRSRSGGTVTVPSRDAFIRLDAEQLARARAFPLAYQDSFPLIPGAYQLAVTLRNLPGHRFTVSERNLSVAALPQRGPALGGIAVGYDAVQPEELGSFASAGSRLLPAGDARFPRGGSLRVLAQVLEARPGDVVRMNLVGPEGVLQRHRSLADVSVAVETLALDGLAPNSYTVLVELVDASGTSVTSKSAAFELVEATELARPALVYRNAVFAPERDATGLRLAEQHLMRGQLVEAERALRGVLDLTGAHGDRVRWQLASVILFSRRADEALELLAPLEDDYPQQVEVVEGLGFSFYLREECVEALPRFERAMALRPPDASLLNATGDCYQQVGRIDKAREMFQLSLAANPGQDAVRARLVELEAR